MNDVIESNEGNNKGTQSWNCQAFLAFLRYFYDNY